MDIIFDIFKKTSEKDGVWVESVEGLHQAKKRLLALATKDPGSYLIFDPSEDKIIELSEAQHY